MTFTPIFIPMHSGGGGGGPIWPIMVINAVLIGGLVKLYDYSFNPQFHFELKPDQKYDYALLSLNKHNHPNIQRVRHLNTECLKKKGYNISSFYKNSLEISKEDFNVKQLIADCKECNTYVEIDYDYNTPFSRKTKDATKRLKWSSCNIRRELE